MNRKNEFQPIQMVLNEVNTLKGRVSNYDWEYRLNRFDEKIQSERREVSNRLKNIKSSD